MVSSGWVTSKSADPLPQATQVPPAAAITGCRAEVRPPAGVSRSIVPSVDRRWTNGSRLLTRISGGVERRRKRSANAIGPRVAESGQSMEGGTPPHLAPPQAGGDL